MLCAGRTPGKNDAAGAKACLLPLRQKATGERARRQKALCMGKDGRIVGGSSLEQKLKNSRQSSALMGKSNISESVGC